MSPAMYRMPLINKEREEGEERGEEDGEKHKQEKRMGETDRAL